MEQNVRLNTGEVVGIATATAAALGSVIVALGRAQEHGPRGRMATIERQARDTVVPSAQAAMQRAASLVEQYPTIRENAAEAMHKAGERLKPAAENVGEVASARAEQARAASADAVERLRETIGPAAAAAVGSLAEQAAHVRERTETQSTGIVESSSRAAEVAMTRTKSATGEMLATLVWIGIAAAVAYFALLNEERRQRVREFLGQSVEQMQMLRSDFAGYDDEI